MFKRAKHWFALLIFLLAVLFDAVVWSGAARLPDVGAAIARSAQEEAPMVSAYIALGDRIDSAAPVLDDWGQHYAQDAFEPGIARIKEDPAVAMDLIFAQSWNTRHATLKFFHWAAPALLLVTIFFWMRRPRRLHMMGGR